MFGPGTQNIDSEASRRRQAVHDGPELDNGSSTAPSVGLADLSRLARISSAASYNVPVRAAAMRGMQQTYGNRAVQRAISTVSTSGRVPVQRDVPVQEEQQVNPAASFMYQPQPFAPIPSPMNGFGGTVPFGPVAAPSSAPGIAQYDENGEVCEMGEDYVLDPGGPNASPNSVPNTDWNEYELDGGVISKIRKGRTTLSKSTSMGRQAGKFASAAEAAPAVAAETNSWYSYVNSLKQGNSENTVAQIAAHDEAAAARVAAESTPSKLEETMEKYTGKTSKFGRTMRGANYGLQFMQNLAEGQSAGEAGFGALAGGYTSNSMGSYLMKSSPKGGMVDAGINLVNAGLNLIPGMPHEVTDVTQVAADATPSSFATSLASNAGRGLWNTGKGIFTGDWSALKKQGEDMTHGKAGAPLQGYATTVEAISVLASGDDAALDRIVEENRSGKRGQLAKWGSQLGGAIYDAKEWAGDKWDSWMGRGTRAQRENAEQRKFAVHLDHLKEERKEREQKAAFDKEMADINAQIEKGPAVPGTMLGGPGDALSGQAIMQQAMHNAGVEEVDEDGVPLPHVSMALPPSHR